jgi:hypothetical protein
VARDVLARVDGVGDELAGTFNGDGSARLRLRLIDRPLAVIRVSPDSLHHLDQERGDRAMLQLLAEHHRQAADTETRRAAARGIVRRSKHLGWYYVDSGRRIKGATTYLRVAYSSRASQACCCVRVRRQSCRARLGAALGLLALSAGGAPRD